jgi:hypothetical protein
MQFKGEAGPTSEGSSVLKVRTTATSVTITTTVGPSGLTGSLQPASGGSASFESEAAMTGDTSFDEKGTITFGDGGHRIHFSTIGQGYIAPSPDPSFLSGTVSWRIDGGEGQFEGAGGLITSNFLVHESGEVTDNQVGVIFLKEPGS